MAAAVLGVAPPIVAVFSVLAEPDPVALDVVLLELAELPALI